jgi:hypothetical protein
MNDLPRKSASSEISALFSMLDPHDVEQFYRAYQFWSLQRQISQLQTLIDSHQQQLTQNAARLQELHPSPIALAALAQLQANGVNDIDLLERMLERGEDWLDRTMQRLAYCEKSALISENYTEWCERALDGAYDWIDSVQDNPASPADVHPAESPSPVEGMVAATATGEQITEAVLLQKLMSDEADASESLQDSTPKRTTRPLEEVLLVEAGDGGRSEAPQATSSEQASSAANGNEASIESVPAGAPTDEPAAIAHGGEELIQLEAGEAAADPAEQLETEPAARTQEVSLAPEQERDAAAVEETALADNQADTEQEHEQPAQPTPRWRKKGFFQRLFRLFRP